MTADEQVAAPVPRMPELMCTHNVGQQIGRERGTNRPSVPNELVDAPPILFSGLRPVAILILGDRPC
ncbi:MAG: hypothetical protein K2X36_06655 [Microbacteriaceae bacterium]|nr:hypothetical protein [Microbacteriaceae bacterium]